MGGPRIPELESCFYCCTLRTGSLIIASASMVICGILCAGLIIPITLGALAKVNHSSHDTIGFASKIFLLVLIMAFVLCAILEALSIFLFIGIKQYKQTYILAWPIGVTAINIIQILMLLLVFLASATPMNSPKELFFLLESCFLLYLTLVVYSYYREVRLLKNTPQAFTNEA